MKTILGVDPGGSGALAFLDDAELLIYDMPYYEFEVNKSLRKRVDFSGICSILGTNKPFHAYVEKVWPQPRDGATGSFSFGWAAAAVEHALISCNVPMTYITPAKWKSDLGLNKDKDHSRFRATQLLPAHRHNWDLKKHDGRAEAALIAYWGKNHGISG